MSPSEQTELLSLLHRALAATCGIAIAVHGGPGEMKRARAAFYRVRDSAGDPALRELALRPNPLDPESELWIVRTGEESGG